MPLRIWTMNASSVALPNTYHQRAPPGTGCLRTLAIMSATPVRSSKVLQARLSSRMIIALADRQGLGGDLDEVGAHANRVAGEGMRRRPRGDRAVGVVDAAVAP